MTTDPTPHLFWITSRAAGTAALILASLAVLLGLVQGGGLLKGRGGELRTAHETLSLATLVAIAIHGLALLGDGYIGFTPADIAIPFASDYKSFWTALGISGGWGLAILGLSYYWRAKIGQARWRKLHRFTALAWLLGLGHAIGMGTDAREPWFLVMTGIVVVPALVLLLAKVARIGSPPQAAAVKRSAY